MIKNIYDTDMLSIQEGIIAHEVNFNGIIISPLSRKIKKHYPIAYTQYRQTLKKSQNRKELLGKVNYVLVNQELFIANCFGKSYYDIRKQEINYNSVISCLKSLAIESALNGLELYIPHGIGCTCCQKAWKEVYDYIEFLFDDNGAFNVNIVY